MLKPESLRSDQHTKNTRLIRFALATFATGAIALTPALASGAPSPTLHSAHPTGFSGALVNQSSRSLYILSSERGAKLKCTGSCLSSWPPLEVSTSTKTVSLGAGVKGKIGFVARGKGKKQVTFNSFPLYTFVGDSGALQSHGQGIKALGGTWTLVKAGASSASTTPFTSATTTTPTTTTTTTPTTTTTTPGGGGGIGY
jgi:predicted lipoprotein with Yx(FWY)xxD motif